MKIVKNPGKSCFAARKEWVKLALSLNTDHLLFLSFWQDQDIMSLLNLVGEDVPLLRPPEKEKEKNGDKDDDLAGGNVVAGGRRELGRPEEVEVVGGGGAAGGGRKLLDDSGGGGDGCLLAAARRRRIAGGPMTVGEIVGVLDGCDALVMANYGAHLAAGHAEEMRDVEEALLLGEGEQEAVEEVEEEEEEEVEEEDV